jgi:hypothetical protein
VQATPIEVRVGRGPRAVEAQLVAEIAAWHAAVRAEPLRLSRPLVVLVPSRSLRDHVADTLVRRLGALAGVAVQTHHTTALQILERAGRRPPAGSECVPVLVRQQARGVAGLSALDELVDGHGAVAAAVSDLLDAGLDETTADPVRDFFAQRPATSRDDRWARAAGVAEVALAVRAELSRRGLGRLGDVIRAACEALASDPGSFVAGRIVLHGFSDATGLVSDFLRALLVEREATVLLDRPPDPADPTRLDLGVAFTRRFEERVAPVAPRVELEPSPPAALEFFRAPGSDAEVRAVARRILARRAAGTAFESIGVVTRTPNLYLSALRVHFGRLGIPFSGLGLSGARSATGRRVAFLLDLLRLGERLPADRFVTALGPMGAARRDDLRLALHALGVARLGDLAGLDAGQALAGADRLPLPVRRGLASGSAGEEPGERAADAEVEDAAPGTRAGPHASRRSLQRETLEEGVARAHRVVACLAGGATPAPLGERLAGLSVLVREGLGWDRSEQAAALVHRLEKLGEALPADLPVRLDELALVLERALGRHTHEPVGGQGGGVQVLDVTEARARTFEHLFLLGLNRDHFPRVVSDDPLLPDELRRQLQSILPELPVKERGHDEERFLFAQLVASSPRVTLSWQVLGDDGKAKAPSPLVDRLLPPEAEVELVPTLLVPEPASADGSFPERPAHEWALLAGLHGAPERVRALLGPAIAEASGLAAAAAERLAEVRTRVIAEADARPSGDPLLGPYFGHVGRAQEESDLRHGELFVTTVERIAGCPWQGFLTRMLRLERPPDALEALPEPSPLLLGRLVHAVLERIVAEVIPEPSAPDRLHEALPVAVPWPAPATLRAFTEDEARRLLRDEGIGVPGFAELLAERMAPYLEAARLADWADGPVPVVGVELEGTVAVQTPSGRRPLRFRADRVDRVSSGLRLTDYKTGKAVKDARGAGTRRGHFEAEIRQGRSLQAAAYSRIEPGAVGRLLFLKPEVSDDSRVFEIGPDDVDLQDGFDAAVARVMAASDAGTFVPRLLDADGDSEPSDCQWCEVAVACLRGDSGARRRLAVWSEQRAASQDPRAAALRGIWSLRGIWWMGGERDD